MNRLQSSSQLCETATTIPIPHCAFSWEVDDPKSSIITTLLTEHVAISGTTFAPSTTSLYISVRTQLIANSTFEEHSHIPPIENSKNDCAKIITAVDCGEFFPFFFLMVFVFGRLFNASFFFRFFPAPFDGRVEVFFFFNFSAASFIGPDEIPPCFFLFTTLSADFGFLVSTNEFPLFFLVFETV